MVDNIFETGANNPFEMLMNGMMMQNQESILMLDRIRRDINIYMRVLFKKNLITEDDIKDSIKEEFNIIKDVGFAESLPSDEDIEHLTKELLLWIKGDRKEIKEMIKQREILEQEMMDKQKHKIDVVSGDAMNFLNNSNPKKLIL